MRKNKNPSGRRRLHQRVKTAKGRKSSSTRWLQRQLNDPYVDAAQREGYRSRAAFKLIGLNDKFKFLKKGATVIDLGAAPGGWSQVARTLTDGGRVIAVDIEPMEPIDGVECVTLDFTAPQAADRLLSMVDQTDVVLSDMAAPSTGHKQTDHLRIMALCEEAAAFAERILKPGGAFVAKVLKGGTENALLASLKKNFDSVRHAKPDASRKESAESYVVALGFRGAAAPSGGQTEGPPPPETGYDPLKQ